jgi:hypothetical protein
MTQIKVPIGAGGQRGALVSSTPPAILWRRIEFSVPATDGVNPGSPHPCKSSAASCFLSSPMLI